MIAVQQSSTALTAAQSLAARCACDALAKEEGYLIISPDNSISKILTANGNDAEQQLTVTLGHICAAHARSEPACDRTCD